MGPLAPIALRSTLHDSGTSSYPAATTPSAVLDKSIKVICSSAQDDVVSTSRLPSPPNMPRGSTHHGVQMNNQQCLELPTPLSEGVVSSSKDGGNPSSLPKPECSSSGTCPSSSLSSAPFRLKPRGTVVSTTDAVRGRKRSAQSMSSAGRVALLTPKCVPTPHGRPVSVEAVNPSGFTSPPRIQSAFRTTTPRENRSPCGILADLQCLSLQSPKRIDGTDPDSAPLSSDSQHITSLPPPSSFSSASPSANHLPMVVNSVASNHSLASPMRQTIQPRSSFTPVQGAASPGGSSLRSIGSSSSIATNARWNTGARCYGFSPNGGGSTKSSPKIASLTVLQDRGTKLPARDNHLLPPLPGGGVSSLWMSLDCSSDDDSESRSPRKMLPPGTVQCRGPSSDSICTVQDSTLHVPAVGTSRLLSPTSPAAGIKSSQQSRTSSKETAPRTPETPLPRVTLTPRSARSCHKNGQRGNHLPRFPSPSDVDVDVSSPFLPSFSAAASLRDVSASTESDHGCSSLSDIQCLFPGSTNSLALSADGSVNDNEVVPVFKEAHDREEAPIPFLDFSLNERGAEVQFESPSLHTYDEGKFMDMRTQSLFTTSRPGGVLTSMMEEDQRKMDRSDDNGSVSDIDEDEDFVLADPAVLEEEHLVSCQPARQRRRRSMDRHLNETTNASNTNLVGMNYVASNTSLIGMDIADPTDSTAGPTEMHWPVLSLPQASASAAKETSSGFLQRRKSDANLTSIGFAAEGNGGEVAGRDLITPPPISVPLTPPMLSPKEEMFLSVAPQTFCIAGADRHSVTRAIAQMNYEAQYHSDASPVV